MLNFFQNFEKTEILESGSIDLNYVLVLHRILTKTTLYLILTFIQKEKKRISDF